MLWKRQQSRVKGNRSAGGQVKIQYSSQASVRKRPGAELKEKGEPGTYLGKSTPTKGEVSDKA